MDRDWEDGYDHGFAAGVRMGRKYPDEPRRMSQRDSMGNTGYTPIKPKPKRKQSGKAKILTDMTRPVWNKYKKGNGKKTYFDIRSQVRRSNAYRKKVKNL